MGHFFLAKELKINNAAEYKDLVHESVPLLI